MRKPESPKKDNDEDLKSDKEEEIPSPQIVKPVNKIEPKLTEA